MLNEVWQMARALEKAEIPVEAQHPLIKPLAYSAKFLLRIRLDRNGHVAAVEDVTDEERSGMRRIVQTSDGSFPILKVNQPILDIDSESTLWHDLRASSRSDKHRLDLLQTCGSCLRRSRSEAGWHWDDITCSIGGKQCLRRSWSEAGWHWNDSLEKADVLAHALDCDPIGQGIAVVSQRFRNALQEDPYVFLCEIGRAALDGLRQGSLSHLAPIQELIVGKGKVSGKDKKVSVLLALDLDRAEAEALRTSGQTVWHRVAEVLPTNLSGKGKHKHQAELSAFGGNGELLKEPFPQVKLPVLRAFFPLLSMASDADKAKCNKRYGLTEYTICPVNIRQARLMQDALTWIVADKREGYTWRGVASGKFEKDARSGKKREKPDLLIAFVDEKPQLDAKTASYFGAGQDKTAAKFEVDAKAVCDALDAVLREKPKSLLRIFLICKASDGQAQIALSESPTAQQAIDAARTWQRAVRDNLPNVTLFLPKGKNLPSLKGAGPLPPYPDQVVRLLSYQWVRDGSSPKPYHEVVGPSLGDVLFLMLREGKWLTATNRMLDLLLQRLSPLLIGIFGAKHGYGPRRDNKVPEPLDDYPRNSRQIALRAVAVLGILLDALESRKEQYMKDVAFQVGQVLALADTLHKDYCTVVRNEQLPNSLVGTSLMRRALDNPAAAIADLGERLMEYVRWAKTVDVPEGDDESERRCQKAVYQARKTLRRYQPLSATLGRLDLPSECSDVMKAQLLLGFLAEPPEEGQHNDGKDGDK